MVPYYERDGIRLHVGDCREVVPTLPEPASAVVTDPPYGISFMSKDWDHEVPGEAFWRVFSDAMLPGAHLLSFGGTRTYHRIAVAIEDAGFEIRDTLMWLYGSGFPKSLDVSKAIDKTAGAEREVVGQYESPEHTTGWKGQNNRDIRYVGESIQDGEPRPITAPATPEAERWEGWGTALKPAVEPVILARKPLTGTVAQNVLEHGTGALNIDGCRIAAPDEQGAARVHNGAVYDGVADGYKRPNKSSYTHKTDWEMQPQGRWPANVILDEHAAAMLDQMSGERKTGVAYKHASGTNDIYGAINARQTTEKAANGGDTGGASRFFPILPIDDPDTLRMLYTPKASRRERNAGLEEMPERKPHPDEPNGRVWDIPGSRSTPRANHHPTVKPLALMRWLLTLVTPPGGIVVDPFVGSGSTLVACAHLGIPAYGIDMNEEYIEIAARRIDHALENRAREAAKPRQLMIAD